MSLNKDKFWKNIKTFVRNNKRNDINKKIKLKDFAEFYSKLFSHDDRKSNHEQDKISDSVKFYFDSINNKELSLINFKNHDIKEVIKELKVGLS